MPGLLFVLDMRFEKVYKWLLGIKDYSPASGIPIEWIDIHKL